MLPTLPTYMVSLNIRKMAVPTRAVPVFLKTFRRSFTNTFVSQIHLNYTQKFSSYLTKN
jgi:hypothetical protein